MSTYKDIFGAWLWGSRVFAAGIFRGKAPAVTLLADWYKCASDIKTLIVATGSYTDSQVAIRKQPWDRPTLSTGGVILSPADERTRPATNKKNEVEHSILVTALVGSNQNLSSSSEIAALLTKRQAIRNALISTPLSTASAYDTVVVPGSVVIDGAFRGMFDATQLTVRCRVRS